MSDPMKILHLASHDGKWEPFVRISALAAALREQGYKSVIAAPEHSRLLELAEASGVETAEYTLAKKLNPFQWRELAKFIAATDAGIVHAHDPNAAVMLARARMFLSGVKTVTTRYDLSPAPVSGEYQRGVNAVVSPSAAVSSLYNPSAGDTKFSVVPAGVYLPPIDQALVERDSIRSSLRDTYCPAKEKPLFIIDIAPMNAEGGQLELLEIFPDIMAARPQCHLFLLGEGDMRDELERRCNLLAIKNDVTFLEPDRSYQRPLAAADLFVSLRTDDGAGIMVEAAMAAGRGVAVTKHGCYPEIVADAKTGVLLPDGAPVKDGILALLQDRQHREQLGRQARTVAAKQYNILTLAETMAEIYKSLK